MSEELEVESAPDEVEEPERPYYVELIELEELRRYVCLDMARMCDSPPKDIVKIARDMEAFLLGMGVRGVAQ